MKEPDGMTGSVVEGTLPFVRSSVHRFIQRSHKLRVRFYKRTEVEPQWGPRLTPHEPARATPCGCIPWRPY